MDGKWDTIRDAETYMLSTESQSNVRGSRALRIDIQRLHIQLYKAEKSYQALDRYRDYISISHMCLYATYEATPAAQTHFSIGSTVLGKCDMGNVLAYRYLSTLGRVVTALPTITTTPDRPLTVTSFVGATHVSTHKATVT